MNTFTDFLEQVEDANHRARASAILSWVRERFPQLEPRIAWKQPMFTDHGTFIIGFSVAKHHLAVALERAGIDRFSAEIRQAGYDHTKQLMRIPWEAPVDYRLLERMIEFNILDKVGYKTFWRK